MKNNNEILVERAKTNAKKITGSPEESGETISVVEFTLLSEKYAFEKCYVSEVLFLREITQIPGVPSFVMGVVDFRSKILSVINLKLLFNLREMGLSELNQVIVLSNGKQYFGVVVDSISGIREIDLSTVSQPLINLESRETEFISGILPDGLILLNAQKMLTSSILIIKQ